MSIASLETVDGRTVLNRSLLGEEIHISSYEEYKKALFKLKLADYQNVFDRHEPELNKSERRLDEFMNALREKAKQGKYVHSKYPPVSLFYKIRAQIEADPLLKIFGAMPKGGNLHVHTSATYNAGKFIHMLCSDTRIKDKAVVYLGSDTKAFKYCQLFFIQDSSLVDNSKGFYYLNDAIKRGKITEAAVTSMISMSDDRIDKVDYIWDEFNDIFARVSPVMKTRTVFEQYYYEALRELVEDNVDYCEIRFGPGALIDNNDELLSKNLACENILIAAFPPDDNTESIELFRKVYYEIRRTCAKDFKVKLVLSGSRKKIKGQSDEEAARIAMEDMKKTQLWKSRIKDEFIADDPVEFIIGYDLVSEEDQGHRTELYAKGIFENGISIPFYFHDGESSWADCDNLYAAYLLGTKRVGHGINLFRFPEVMRNVIENDIALEVCPISNQLLRYTPDLRMHPVGEFLKRGVQCVICSDDPQIFNYSGLKYDFLEIYYALLVDLRSIKKLVRNSYLYSGMNKKEVSEKIEAWQKKWDAFVVEALAEIEQD